MLHTLLSVRVAYWKNSLCRGTAQERRRAQGGLFACLVIIVGIGLFAYAFLAPFVELSYQSPAMQKALERLPAFACFAAFWMLLVSGVTVGIQTFYLQSDLSLLLSAPISPRAIFAAKFVEATLTNAALSFTLGAPVLLAYSFARGTITPPFLLHLLLLLIAYATLPTALGVLFAFLLMRVLPANRTRDLLAALGILVFAGGYFAVSIAVSRLNNTSALQHGIEHLAATLDSPAFHLGVWAWAGDILSGAARGNGLWLRLGWLWLVAGGTILLTAGAAQAVYWRGWTNAQESGSRVRICLGGTGNGWEQRLARLPGPLRAVFLKDMRSLGRDMRQLSLLFIPVAVIAVFLFNITQSPLLASRRLPTLMLVLSLFLILAPISLRLAMSGFVTENQAVWLMLAAPNDPAAMLFGKFLYTYLLSLPLAVAATVLCGLIQRVSVGETLLNLLLVLCAMASFCGIGVGASAFFSDFRTDNPRFTISAVGRLCTVLGQIGYLLLLGVVAVVGAVLLRQGIAASAVIGGGAAVILVLSALAVFGSLEWGARRLRRMEW